VPWIGSYGQTPAEAAASSLETGNDTDDLKLIKGIGPAIEQTLNELGIHRFAQIADMSEYEIDRIAQHLKGFRSRIYREDWLGQARDLRYQKSKQLT
jgi:predicted flap endonuclease-1-like 5' DNA nuclease